MPRSYLRLILICAAALIFVQPATASRAPGFSSSPDRAAADSARALRRLATTARLAAEEYQLGVRDGRVVLAPEVEEARLFFDEARKSAADLPGAEAALARQEIGILIGMVNRLASPDSVQIEVERLVVGLASRLAISLDETPAVSPSLARGETIYRQQCVSCHGLAGDGDGPAAAGLSPAPAVLSDHQFFRDASPLDFYRRVTIGVAGTAMPSYEMALSLDDRWAVALYASTLRLPAARGTVSASLADFRVSAALSDAALMDSLRTDDLARLAAARAASGGEGRSDYRPVFALVRSRVDSAYDHAAAGRVDSARTAAINAYMAFERVERELRLKEPALVAKAEKAFADLRDQAEISRLAVVREELARTLDRAEQSLGTALTPVSLFLQSFLILIREGLEAILVIGALLAFLGKVGAADRKRDIHIGVGVALALSVLTAIGIETVFRLGPAHQEALEGLTMVVATIMLFSVSYWLLSKMELAKWNQFVRSRLSEAVGRKSVLALASVAFLAVYREGFETVLFYKALAVSGGSAATFGPIAAGFLAAALVLAVIFIAISRFGLRLPLKPFFAVTSGFLYLMAFIFAGTAVAELQEGGLLPITSIPGMFRMPTLGIYPTVQSVAVQVALLSLAAAALVWTFILAPRRATVATATAGERVVRARSGRARIG